MLRTLPFAEEQLSFAICQWQLQFDKLAMTFSIAKLLPHWHGLLKPGAVAHTFLNARDIFSNTHQICIILIRESLPVLLTQ